VTSPASSARDATPVVVRTVEAEVGDSLISLLPAQSPLSWVHRGDGLVAWGESARFETGGPYRFEDAARWWREFAAGSVIRDEADIPGSGLVCFGSFGYFDSPGSSVLVVPEVVVGRRGSRAWVTTISPGTLASPPVLGAQEPFVATTGAVFTDGAMSGASWELVVAEAVRRIRAGHLDKVVLARDLVAELDQPVDVRSPLSWLDPGDAGAT
jgi:menaquinone-specific isochorismate synthase